MKVGLAIVRRNLPSSRTLVQAKVVAAAEVPVAGLPAALGLVRSLPI